VSGTSVTLTLSSGVLFGQSVTVAYTAPATNPTQDPAGNDAASFSAVAVTNNTPNTPPTANATSATTPMNTAVSVPLSGSDAETCQLTFSIVTGPSHGSLGSIGNTACSAGNPNTDSAPVTYTPTTGFSGPDSFTYKVNDGTTDSTAKTATLTVNAPAGGTFTFQATEDAQVKSTSPTTNYGALTTMQLREEPAGGTLPTYRDYLKFNVTGMTGTVTSVKLRLWITDTSPDSGTVFGTSTAWSESTITWSGTNAAPALGSSFGSAGATTVAGAWVEITLVGSPVNGNVGNVAFALKTTSTNSSIFDSSEGVHPPELVVTTN
jgi:trimeric autotransporter adhesin